MCWLHSAFRSALTTVCLFDEEVLMHKWRPLFTYKLARGFAHKEVGARANSKLHSSFHWRSGSDANTTSYLGLRDKMWRICKICHAWLKFMMSKIVRFCMVLKKNVFFFFSKTLTFRKLICIVFFYFYLKC